MYNSFYYFSNIQWFIFLQLLVGVCNAQSYNIKTLSAKEGLSQGMITALCQDSDGFIWVGTLSGLNRYDGNGFQTFLHQANDPYSPAGNVVTGIIEDSKGRIWVGFNEGLDCYDRKTGRFYHLGTAYNVLKKENQDARPVYETDSGHIWLCGHDMVVEMRVPDDFPANPESIHKFQYDAFTPGRGLPNDVLGRIGIMQLPQKNVGLYFNNGETITAFRFDKSKRTWDKTLPTVTPTQIETANCEILYDTFRKGYWVLKDHALYLLKNGQFEQKIPLPAEITGKEAPNINDGFATVDKYGNLWIALSVGLYQIVPANADSPAKTELIFNEKKQNIPAQRLIQDRQGTIWIGTIGYGLVHIQPQQQAFSYILEGNSLGAIGSLGKNDSIFVVSKDIAHHILPNNTLHPIKMTLKGGQYPVTNILRDNEGNVFFRYIRNTGSYVNYYLGIRYANGSEHEIEIPAWDTGDPIFQDKQQRLWLLSSSGDLACLPKGAKEIETYSYSSIWKNGETNTAPKQMYQSQNGALWIATQQGLIEMAFVEKGKPTFKLWQNAHKNPYSLSNNVTLSLLDDPVAPDSFLWIGTNGSGLNKMNKKIGRFEHYTQKEGLPNSVIYGILADSYGRLWLSTNYGLSCFSPSTHHFRNFTLEDGLQDNEFNTYSFYKNAKGKMYFGGINGLTSFMPDSILPQKTFSPVFFTGLKINNRTINVRDSSNILPIPLEYAKEITLKYDQNFINVSFAALNFAQNGKNVFYYKMDGIDPEWVYADKRTEVNYPNLAPGTYTLHVANVNENGDRNPQEATITFVVMPPWWRTWTAYMVYAILIVLGLWWIITFQVKRVKLQNELSYKEKEAKNLQALDELKTRFFTNITHEFRTPLTLIVEPAHQILQTMDLVAAKTQSRIILNNANRLLSLVNQLLDLSKIEDGKIHINWAEGDLCLILQEVVAWFQPVMDKKRQQMLWENDISALNGVIDRQILEKIVYNLLSNAHKFTPEGGTITLHIAQPTPDMWQMQVQDTGIGIAADKLPHIFDRFYQVDNTLTRRNEGTGIGLALVKELCGVLGGDIQVESEIGKGTTFTLRFPLRPKDVITVGEIISNESILPQNIADRAQGQPLSYSENEDSENCQTILVVEDNAEMREYLHVILTQKGYQVQEAENGKIGVAKALELVPDLIISDVMMPEMDGYTLTETLKNNNITSHIPIVILTAKGRQESKIEGYRRGADAYLPKPFNTEELLVRLQQLLETRHKIQQKYQAATFGQAIVPNENIHSEELKLVTELPISDIDIAWITELQVFIQKNMASDTFAIDDLPTQFLMNRTQFYAKVKALTGLTPARLIRNIRLDTAYQLLCTQPDLAMKQVVRSVGLNDLKNFNHIFTAHFGFSPQDVIKQNNRD